MKTFNNESGNRNTVSIVRIKDDFADSLRKALDLIGNLDVCQKNLTFVIKPNLCTNVDISGFANVSVQTVKAVIDYILRQQQNPTIKIVESDSTAKDVDKAFKHFGYLQLQQEYQGRGFDVSIVNLSKEPTKTVFLKGLYFKKIELPEILIGPKYFISVANAKTHELTKITGVLKNQFGLLPKKYKKKYHKHINEVIVDLNTVVKPDICIIDGKVGMEDPIKGHVQDLGLILCGSSPASIDATLARVMGFDPAGIKHILLAEKQGLGTIHPKVVGEQVYSVMMKFRKPHTTIRMLGEYVPKTLRPMAIRVYKKFIQR